MFFQKVSLVRTVSIKNLLGFSTSHWLAASDDAPEVEDSKELRISLGKINLKANQPHLGYAPTE